MGFIFHCSQKFVKKRIVSFKDCLRTAIERLQQATNLFKKQRFLPPFMFPVQHLTYNLQMAIIERQVRGTLLQVVYFEPAFNEQLIELDTTSEMSVYLCGLIRFGRNITLHYSDLLKYKGYREGMILVARVKNGPLIGKVCVGIKDTHLFGKSERAAYMFDMRIDVNYQRMGVGRLMYQAIIAESKKKGCTVAVCSVNSNNTKSVNFFLKSLSFNLGSERKIFSASASSEDFSLRKMVQLPDGSDCHLDFLEAGDNKIAISVNEFDYCPMDKTELTTSKHYLGCIKAESGSDKGEVHLYNGDKQFGMVPQRIFLTMDTWKRWDARFFVMLFLLSGPLAMIFGSLNYTKGEIVRPGLFYSGIGIGLLMIGLQCAFYKLFSLFTAPFIRAFGYQFSGTKNQKPIFDLLLKQVKNFANSRGAKTIRVNEDIRAPYLGFAKDYFTSFGGKVNTMFLYKFFDERLNDGRMFSENNFFDPRDL